MSAGILSNASLLPLFVFVREPHNIGRQAKAPRYLIRDQDGIYGAAVARRLRAMGIGDKPIAPGSPWQNAFAERLIGSIRRERVDLCVPKTSSILIA